MNKRIFAILVAPLFFVGCSIRLTSSKVVDGGIFRSTDYAETWKQQVFVSQVKKKIIAISDVGIAKVIFYPHNPDEIIVTTLGNGVYRTTNDTESWQQTNLRSGSYNDFSYDPLNPSVQYAAIGASIIKSSDGGAHWQTVYTETRGEQMTSIAVDAYDDERIYAGTSGGTIVKSLNGGSDWAALFDVNDSLRAIQISPQDTRTVYAVTTSNGIYRTTDAGTTWTQLEALTKFGGAGQVHQLIFVPGSPNRLVAATNYGLMRSDDGGMTWTAVKTLIPFNTVPLQTVAIDPKSTSTIYFSVNNLIHKSEDNGTTWRTISTVPTKRFITQLVVSPAKDGVLYLGTIKLKK